MIKIKIIMMKLLLIIWKNNIIKFYNKMKKKDNK